MSGCLCLSSINLHLKVVGDAPLLMPAHFYSRFSCRKHLENHMLKDEHLCQRTKQKHIVRWGCRNFSLCKPNPHSRHQNYNYSNSAFPHARLSSLTIQELCLHLTESIRGCWSRHKNFQKYYCSKSQFHNFLLHYRPLRVHCCQKKVS